MKAAVSNLNVFAKMIHLTVLCGYFKTLIGNKAAYIYATAILDRCSILKIRQHLAQLGHKRFGLNYLLEKRVISVAVILAN